MDIQSVALRGEGVVELVWIEDRDVSERHVLARNVIFDASTIPEALSDFVEAAEDFLDAVLLSIRNPAPTATEDDDE